MDVKILLLSTICFVFPSRNLGAFSFDTIKEDNEVFCDACHGSCSGTTTLLWNYVTDETVTVIEWYKQPDQLIARIFGVGAPFTVLPPYNTVPYTVTQFQTSKYNAGIKITGLSAADVGVYSVNVTAASPQSAIMIRRMSTPLLNSDKLVVTCNPNTCTLPTTADSVTTVLTRHGDKYRCTLLGGNAACSCDTIYAECSDEPSTYDNMFLSGVAMLVVGLVSLLTALTIEIWCLFRQIRSRTTNKSVNSQYYTEIGQHQVKEHGSKKGVANDELYEELGQRSTPQVYENLDKNRAG